MVYADAFGPAAFIGRARVVPLRNMGAAISPFNSFIIFQGLETLSLRMERHTENALKVAKYLAAHDRVEWVHYAGLEGDQYFELAKKVVSGKPSGVSREMVRISVGIEHIDELIEDIEQALVAAK